MQSKFFALSGLAGAFAVAGAASAAFTGITHELVDSAALGWNDVGYDPGVLDTYRIYASFDDNLGVVTGVGDIQDDIDFALTTVDADGNTELGFFNSNAAGASDLPSNPAFWTIAGFEDLQWDTFVSIGAAGEPVATTAAAPFFVDQAMGMVNDFTLDDTGWFVSGFPPQGDATNGKVLLAQVTVDEGVGVNGDNWRVSGLAVSGDSGSAYDIFDSFVIPPIPAPGVLALLGVAGLVSSRRRS